ncbi:MAG: slipin family protein [Oscillospiraceae bacterium]|nr:slipin family protein [Oscillospiraceae bacterium]
MKVIINENQKGLLFNNGILKNILGAGKYSFFGGKTVEKLSVDEEISSAGCTLRKILDCPDAKGQISEVTVKNGEVCLHYIDGCFENCLTAGHHAFWNDGGAHEFRVISTDEPKITDVPAVILSSLSAGLVTQFLVPEHCRAIIYYNGKPAEYLEPGKYPYWNGAVRVTCALYDMRLREMPIAGQEILTKDKVGVRVNFVLNWRITDYIKVSEITADIDKNVYTAAQLALRDYLGGKTMDELLGDRENIGNELIEQIKKRTGGMFIEVVSAGIKDVILPGEITAIMNTVLAAEKRAQANVITRREEVASTRSLLNTAKLLEENKTLRRLKELEYIEKIFANVGEITVDARSSLLNQLAQIIGDKDE